MRGCATWACAVAVVLGCASCGSANTRSEPEEGVTYLGTIYGYELTGSKPLEGVKVWAVGRPELGSTTSDVDGHYVWKGLPPGDEIVIRGHKDGWTDGMTVTVVADSSQTGYDGDVAGTATLTGIYLSAKFAKQDTNKATLAVQVRTPDADGGTSGVAGATVTISPASGEGPVYATNDTPDPSATETDTGGTAIWGNIDPGAVEVTVTPPAGMSCGPSKYSWPAKSGGTVSGQVEAGAVAVLEADCQ